MTADDFWLEVCPPERREMFAAPAEGPPLLEFARRAEHPDVTLPDTPEQEIVDGITWAPGALAGVLGHHAPSPGSPGEPFMALARTVDAEARGGLTREDLLATYESLKTVQLASPREFWLALTADGEPRGEERSRLVQATAVVSGWLVCRGAHRGPVKAGLAAGSLFTWEPLAERAAELGRLAELSKEACTLLRSHVPPGEQALLGLARWHDGWGRVNAVESLLALPERAATTDDWLVTAGWDNRIHPGYTAPLIAGHVDVASRVLVLGPDGAPDRERLDSIRGLLNGLLDEHSPGAHLADVPGMLEVVEQWLLGLSMLPPDGTRIEDLLLASTLGTQLDEDIAGLAQSFGPEGSQLVAERCAALLVQDSSRAAVLGALADPEGPHFLTAARLAHHHGIDPVPAALDRLRHDPDDTPTWFWLCMDHVPHYGVRLVDFGIRTLPPGLVSSTERMPGSPNDPDVHMGVMALWQGPGEADPEAGWRLVDALLRSHAQIARRRGVTWLRKLPPATVAAHADSVAWFASHDPDPALRAELAEVLSGPASVDGSAAPNPTPTVTSSPPPEVVVRQAAVLCWKGPKMGMTVLNARSGGLYLTNRRLVFTARDERHSRDIPLASIRACTAGKKRALVVEFDEGGRDEALTFGQQMGMPDLDGWVAAIEQSRTAR